MQMQLALKELVAAESWKSDQNAKAIGTIRIFPSTSSVLNLKGKEHSIVVENSVLMIRQTNENHLKIAQLIRNVENGSSGSGGVFGGGGLGGGGSGLGGFGGGLFSIPNQVDRPAESRTPLNRKP